VEHQAVAAEQSQMLPPAIFFSLLAWIIHDFASKKRKGALKD
jgi:hypothetical protein